MAPLERTVLLTGCSEGGLGDSLARTFHARGLRVIATARNPSKITHFESLGIETLLLDVQSADSISSCISAVTKMTGGSLDILVNNSGGGLSMPLADVSVDAARKLFDLNVWAVLSVTQAFLPLLLNSAHGGMLVNNTSIVSVFSNPMAGIYNASKAATAMLTDNLRIELAPFNVKVVELKTGTVKSKFFENQSGGAAPQLPEGSIYSPAREAIEEKLKGSEITSKMVDAEPWAESVVKQLLKSSPAAQIWKGGMATLVWFTRTFLPHTFPNSMLEPMGALDVLRVNLAKDRKN